MHFAVKNQKPAVAKSACLVVGLYEGKTLPSHASTIDKAYQGLLSNLVKSGDFTGKQGQTSMLYASAKCAAKRVLVVGFGKKSELTLAKYKKSVQAAAQAIKAHGLKEAAFSLHEMDVAKASNEEKLQQAILAVHQASYEFNTFKSKPEKTPVIKWTWLSASTGKKMTEAAKRTIATAKGMGVTQDLGNMPGNVCHPTYMASYAKKLAAKTPKMTCKVVEEAEMKKLKMGSFLAVSQGSIQAPKLVALEYKGGKTGDKPIIVLGKGITFDTGGVSLKPAASMVGMKFDMCGAATVMGVMHAISEMKLPINVVGLMACAENMPSHKASRPDDIVTSMSGTTIEISNTDAEGRLVLCDSLTYGQKKYKPKEIIDIATLTGACVVALGNHATGLYSNHEPMAKALVKAGEQSLDRAWQMPLWDDYQDQLKSSVADVNNIGGPAGGSITAACFLSRFTKDVQWAHLDIAGTASAMKQGALATGRPVPMLVQYLINKCGG